MKRRGIKKDDQTEKRQLAEIRLVSTVLLVENEQFKWVISDEKFKFLVLAIEEIGGLISPLKVCSLPNGTFMPVEDNYDLRAIKTLGYKKVQVLVCDELREKGDG